MQGISYLLITSENYPAPYNKEPPYFTSNSIIYSFFENFSNFILYIYIPYFMTYTNVCFIHKQKTRTFLHSIRKVLVLFMIFIPFHQNNCRKEENRNMFPDMVLFSNYSATIHFQRAQIHDVS